MPSSAEPRRNPPGEFAALVFAVVAVLIFLACSIWFWLRAPDVVASHFDDAGQPDDWSSKGSLLALFVPLGVGIPALMSIRWIWEKLPTGLINIPSKEYWLERGEADYLYDCLIEFMRVVAGLVALLFTSVLVIIMREARTATMPEWMTFVPTAVFLVAVGLAVWRLLRRLRPPR